MKKVLVSGGTSFVSRYVAEYYVSKGWDVYVLNRNTRPQSPGVTLIEADRKKLGNALKGHHFDVVFDITAFNAEDINALLDGLDTFKDYIMISSSAVYPESSIQPFTETMPIGENRIWGPYGIGKVEAERTLRARFSNAYILRPPYLYGPMNNVYREAFVFDCAIQNRKFYLPSDGQMKLQFFYIEDLCRFMDAMINFHPTQKIFNVGNEDAITVRKWVEICYRIAGKTAEFVNVDPDIEPRSYFSFYNYDYYLDIQKQKAFLPITTPIEIGLRASFEWYIQNPDKVNRKPLMAFIDSHLK